MNQVDELLSRRVEQVLPDLESLTTLLNSGKKLKVYQGFDPTGIKLHLGHSIGLRNLQKFVELGHHVKVLFGTGTVLVGDPSQRDSGRKLITPEEVESNIATWKSQVGKIIDLERVEVVHNGDWLLKMNLKDIINLASNITAVQLFKRDSFTKRIDRGDTVWFHETLYPLLQGYDSVVMDVDIEVGGSDQTFNMLVGRQLQKRINNREKYVLTNPMILGTDGQNMSKSTGNCIWLDDKPEDMYGKVMSIPDEQIIPYMKLLTDIPLESIPDALTDPMAEKKRLALDITQQFHGQAAAMAAAEQFKLIVQQHQIPSDIPALKLESPSSLLAVLEQAGLGSSNSQRKAMIAGGGVYLNQAKVTDPQTQLIPGTEYIIKYGKRNFLKLEDK